MYVHKSVSETVNLGLHFSSAKHYSRPKQRYVPRNNADAVFDRNSCETIEHAARSMLRDLYLREDEKIYLTNVGFANFVNFLPRSAKDIEIQLYAYVFQTFLYIFL